MPSLEIIGPARAARVNSPNTIEARSVEIDEDLLAPATLVLVIGASIHVEHEVLKHRVASMLCSPSLQVIRPPDADYLASHRIAEDVRTAAHWHEHDLTGNGQAVRSKSS